MGYSPLSEIVRKKHSRQPSACQVIYPGNLSRVSQFHYPRSNFRNGSDFKSKQRNKTVWGSFGFESDKHRSWREPDRGHHWSQRCREDNSFQLPDRAVLSNKRADLFSGQIYCTSTVRCKNPTDKELCNYFSDFKFFLGIPVLDSLSTRYLFQGWTRRFDDISSHQQDK